MANYQVFVAAAYPEKTSYLDRLKPASNYEVGNQFLSTI